MITDKTKKQTISQIASLLKKLISEANEIEKFTQTMETQNNRTVTRIEIISR